MYTPEYISSDSGYRYYGTEQFEVLNTIRYLRALDMPLAEIEDLVYAIGQQVRTRRWTWRQSENGKITSASTDIFFPIDGFTDFNRECVLAAQDELQMRIARIWGCKTIVGLVDSENPYMEL